MLKVKVLGHACLLLETSTTKLIVDPWLVGSCYWRSWWNYPPTVVDESDLADVDAVLISHIHWDHWHGPTLKRYFRGAKVVVGDDPNPRSVSDLRSIGFENIVVAKHGKEVRIGDVSVYFYHFGLLLNDSALVFEAEGKTVLNANDAKIAGPSLLHLKNKHPKVDLALRSHSSANSRICYSVEGETAFVNDDRMHYFRSFKLFMDVVQPKFAIPFASNHCHLTDDTFDYNSYVSTPFELIEYLSTRNTSSWEPVVMLPGATWLSDEGFKLSGVNSFDDRPEKLAAYRDAVADRLEFYSERERATLVNEALLTQFSVMVSQRLWLSPKPKIKLVLTKPDGVYLSVLVHRGKYEIVENSSPRPECGWPVLEMPAIVFRDAVVKNMFHHAGISKRCKYSAANKVDMKILQSVVRKLERRELIGERSVWFARRWLFRNLGRWRNFLVFGLAAYYLFVARQKIYDVEESILRRHSGADRER